jgi:hypothetical protein
MLAGFGGGSLGFLVISLIGRLTAAVEGVEELPVPGVWPFVGCYCLYRKIYFSFIRR